MPRHLHIFGLFTSAYFLSYFFRSANAVIAPDLSRELSLGAAQLGLMTSLFFAAFALTQIPLGIGLDHWGPRWVTPGLMLVGALGSLVFAVAPSFSMLAAGRALIGVGMAGVLMGSLKIFSQWYPPGHFATVSALLVGIGSSGALIAATPLAWLNNAIGWRAAFVIGAVVIAVVAGAIMLWTRNTPPGVPWVGTTQATGGLRTVFANRHFWRIAPLNFFMTGALQGFQALWAGPYLFDVLRLNEIQAGNLLLLLGVGTTIGFGVSGWLADRLGLIRVVVFSGLVFVVCQLALVVRPPILLVSLIYPLLGLSGGFGLMLLAHVRRVFVPGIIGQAVTAVNLFGIGGTFLLQWWQGLIIGAFAADAVGHYPPTAYSAALGLTAIGTLVTLLWYIPLGAKREAQSAEREQRAV